MKIKDFNLTAKGYFARRKSDDMSFAKVAFYIAAIHQNIAGKPLTGKQFINEWFGEKVQSLSTEEKKKRSEEMMKRVRLTNKILEEKQKLKKKQVA